MLLKASRDLQHTILNIGCSRGPDRAAGRRDSLLGKNADRALPGYEQAGALARGPRVRTRMNNIE